MIALYTTATRRWISTFCAGLLALGHAAGQGSTPAIYSNSGMSGATVTRDCNVLGCFGSVTNPELATDADFTTAATMDVPLSALVTKTLKLRMDMDGLVPVGHRAGIMIARDGGVLNLLGLNLASLIRVRTYLSSNGGTAQLQETKTIDASLAGVLLGSSTAPMPLEFTAGLPFDQIEIEASSLVGLGYKLKVYYAYGIGANQMTTAKGYLSRFAAPVPANYSTRAVDNGITLCVNSSVSNPTSAVDADLDNYATMGTLLDLSCPTTLQTQLEGTAPAGYYAGFMLGSAGLLDASILGGLRLTTYLGNTVQETGTGAGLLNLNVLPGSKYNIRMATTKPFDRVEIRRVSLLGALNNLRVYYGFGLEPRVFRDLTGRISSFANPVNHHQVNGSLICAGCGIANPESAVDQDLTGNSATYNAALAVRSTTRLKMQLNGPAKAGNRAGVVLALATGLVDAQLLSSIRINTYTGVANGTGTDGLVLVESISNAALLSAELLADGKQEITFRTTREFDWVELELKNGVAALASTGIYYAFADDLPTGFPSVVAPLVISPVTLASFQAITSDGYIDVTWATSAEANSSHFIVERSLSANGNFQSLGRVNAAGNSTTTRQYQFRDLEGVAFSAPNLYYRLRQVDLDGQETFSAVTSVSLRPPVVVFDLYPNPASPAQQVRMTMPGQVGEKYQVAVYNQLGREVSRQKVSGARSTLSTSNLAPGLYQVTLLNKGGQRVGAQRLLVR